MASVGSGAETIRQAVAATVSDDPIETVFYREERGTLDDSSTVWREFESVDELPERSLAGWEELIVFTENHVHRWVETGYGGDPTTLPRNPELIVPDPDFLPTE